MQDLGATDKRPVRWITILAQFGISLLFGVVSIFVNVGLLHLFGHRPTEPGFEFVGKLTTDAIILIFGLSMAFARGKIRATVIIGSVAAVLFAAYLLFILIR